MSDEAKGGAPKKLTTAEILAAARAKKGGAVPPSAAADAPPPAASPAEVSPALAATSESPAAPAPAAPAGKPKSTAEILAAARAAAAAKAAGGDAAPAAPPKPAAAPAAAGGKPKSTAEILAAARAAKAGGAASSAEAAPAAPTASPKESPKAPVAAGLSVEEMVAAARPASVVVAATGPDAGKPVKPEAPALKPIPSKPVPAAKKVESGPSRREVLWGLFLAPFAMAWWALGATTLAATLGVARFMLPNVLTEPPRKFKIGSVSDYDLGTVATKWVAQYGVWIVHTEQYQGRNLIYALISVCTHLGCTPSWLEGEQKFKCPCHGSGFYITGVNFEGPAPRPLERAGIRIAEDGMLEVDKSVKFQEEMGQWTDSTSYVEIV